MSKEKKNSSLIEIRDILKEEMDKFTAINNEIIDNQNDFEKITENYNKYDNLIDKGKSHITDLNRQEMIENLFIYIGFYFYWACVIYVLLKRFPIHKIIGFLFKILKKIIMLFVPGKGGDIISTVGNFTNSTLNNTVNQILNYTVNQMENYTVNQMENYTVNQMENYTVNKFEDYIVNEMENYIVNQMENYTVNDIFNYIVNKMENYTAY